MVIAPRGSQALSQSPSEPSGRNKLLHLDKITKPFVLVVGAPGHQQIICYMKIMYVLQLAPINFTDVKYKLYSRVGNIGQEEESTFVGSKKNIKK